MKKLIAWFKNTNTANIVLVLIGIATVLFVLKMIHLFETQYSIPDTLCTCYFSAVVGECGVLGWIKTAKVRHQDRQWQNEDYERFTNDTKGENK